MQKYSVSIKGHRTSISLEAPFWDELTRIAQQRNIAVASLVADIDKQRSGGLSSAIRLFILAELKQNAAGCGTILPEAAN